MAEPRVTVVLTQRDVELVELADVDDDAGAALEFVRRVVKPQVDAALRHG